MRSSRPRHVVAALILSFALFSTAVPSTYGTPPAAASCAEELARQDAALRQFEADARREGLNFALEDPRRAALDAVKKRLEGDPTADAVREVRARWDEYQAYVKKHDVYREVLDEISKCLRSGNADCLTAPFKANLEPERLMDRFNEAFQKWVNSLGNEAISKAVERAERARDIMKNFTARAANMSMDAAARGIDSCLRDFEQRAQPPQNTTPVDVQPPPPPGAATTPKKGGVGKLVPTLIAGAIGGGALWYTSTKLGELDGAGDDGGGSSIRLVSSTSIQCTPVGGNSLQSVCRGSVTLDVGSVFSAGTRVCILTEPSAFPSCQTRSSSSQMRFDIDERIIGCRPTQTLVNVYKDDFINVVPSARLSTSIPVACS